MAKEKRSAADLDAELAALEAELAALENKPRKKAAKPAPAVARPREETPPPARAEKQSRFALPKFGKKHAEPAPEPGITEAVSEPASARPPSHSPAPPPSPHPPSLLPPPSNSSPQFDLSVWRQEGDAWIRMVPDTPVPVVRRVLDEHGNLVREEEASARDVDDASGVKAERGLGRLLRRK